MFEKFLTEGWDSFRQRYEGTYGFFRNENGKTLLVNLQSVNDRICNFVDARGVDYHINADTEKNIGFYFLPPKPRYYNTDKGTFLVRRIAQRQFQRGINHRNTAIHSMMKSGLIANEVNFLTLGTIFQNEHEHIDVFEYLAKHGGCAISNQLALSGTGGLYLFNNSIGTFALNPEKRSAKVELHDAALFRTEIVDAFKSKDISVEVN